MKKMLNEIRKAIILIKKTDRTIIAVIIIQAMLNSIYPYVSFVGIAAVIDCIIQEEINKIPYYLTAIVAVQGILSLLRFAADRVYQYKCVKIDEMIKYVLHKNILDIPFEIFQKPQTQEQIKQAESSFIYTGGYIPLLNYLLLLAQSLLSLIVGIAAIVGLCGGVNYRAFNSESKMNIYIFIMTFFLIVLLGYYIIYIVSKKYSDKSERQLSAIMEDEGKLSYYLFQVFNDYEKGKSVRLHKMRELIMGRYNKLFAESKHKNIVLLKINGKINFLTSFLTVMINCIIYAFVIWFSLLGYISIGQITIFINGMDEINAAAANIIRTYRLIQRQFSQLNKYLQIEELAEKETHAEGNKADCFGCSDHKIEFVDVGYKYENSEQWIFRHFNCTLSLDKTISIVGENGAGKTTLIKLLLGLYQPLEGKIFFDDCEISTLDKAVYRSLFSVVFQDFNLYAFPISDNIVAGKKREETMLRTVLEKAGLFGTVQKLPQKADTPLFSYDETGINLSGGERQRLAIARGLYKDALIWIMDEPTSALDPISEAEIFDDLNSILGNKPCIFISHRLSSCQMSDEILVIADGRIEERGNHETLLKEAGLYASMWNEQAKYFN